MKLLKKGEAPPFPEGTKFMIKSNGNILRVLGECPCTDSYLHYQVKGSSGIVSSILHSELVRIGEVVH